MKKLNVLLLGCIVALGLSSCIKDGESYDPMAQWELEKPALEEYAKEHFTDPHLHEQTGIWYEIVEPGDPSSFTYKMTYPVVHVNYIGELLNGTEFDSHDSAAGAKFSLGGGIIPAWQAVFFPEEILYDDKGEPLDEPYPFGGITSDGLKKGSVIRFVTPSYLAYGNGSSGKITANSPLYFEIKVIDIEDPTGTGN